MDPMSLFLSGDLSDLTIRVHVGAEAPPSSSSAGAATAAEGDEADAARPAKRGRFASTGGGKAEAAEEAKAEGRPKEDKKEEAAAAAAAAAAPVVHVIKAHTFPLVTSSNYFAAAMVKNRWIESEERVLDMWLPDEEALEDFKLLLQGAYTRSFVWLEEEELFFPKPPKSRETAAAEAKDALIRRLVMGDAYGFEDAVSACAMELSRLAEQSFSFDNAASAFEAIPEPLLGQTPLCTLVHRLGVILAKEPPSKPDNSSRRLKPRFRSPVPPAEGMEEGNDSDESLLINPYDDEEEIPQYTESGSATGYPLTRAICDAGGDCWRTTYQPCIADFIDERLKALPLPAIEALLKSADEAKALPVAEDRYWLVHGWFDHQERQGDVFHSPQEARDAFARLLRALTLQRMDRRFTGDVVMRATDVQALDGQAWAIMSSLLIDPSFGSRYSPPSYSSPRPPCSIFGKAIEADVRIPAACCRSLALGASRYACVLLGVPLTLKLMRQYDSKVGFEWGLAFPDRQAPPPSRPRPSLSELEAASLQLDIEVTLAEAAAFRTLLHCRKRAVLLGDEVLQTATDVTVGEKWEGVFAEGSRYLNAKDELVLHIKVTMCAPEASTTPTYPPLPVPYGYGSRRGRRG